MHAIFAKIRGIKNAPRFSTGARWLGTVALSLLAALLVETLVFNFRALTTADCQPTELDLEAFALDEAASYEDGVIVAQGRAGETLSLICEEIYEETRTVRLRLSGEGAVECAFRMEDEGRAYSFFTAYQAMAVAEDPTLSTVYATVSSRGDLLALELWLTPEQDGEIRVEEVTLNAPVPLVLQPLRMAAVFLACLLLLAGMRFRWYEVDAQPRRWSHRLVIALPLAALMAFSAVLAQWIDPEPLFTGRSEEEAAVYTKDAYAVLWMALKDGSLSVPFEPSEELLMLDNPYDRSEREEYDAPCRFDYAFYEGKYYVYFGLAPVLTVYAPFNALTGRVPAPRDCALLLTWLGIAMIGWAVCGLARRYLRHVNLFALSLCCVATVFASGLLLLMASADFYYNAMVASVTFGAGAVAFGVHGVMQKRRVRRAAQFVGSGLCAALMLMSRPNALMMIAALLAPMFLGVLLVKNVPVRHKLADAAAFLVPALLGAGLAMAYNQARFGSPLDFGASYQLTLTDVSQQRLSLYALPEALWHYLLEQPNYTSVFPYISPVNHFVPATGSYVFDLENMGVLAQPMIWLIFLLGFAFARNRRMPSPLRRELKTAALLPLAVSLPLMVYSLCMAGTILRYTCDYLLVYALIASLAMLAVTRFRRDSAPEKKALAMLAVALCVATVLVGFCLLFANERNYVQQNAPAVFYTLQRMLPPYC